MDTSQVDGKLVHRILHAELMALWYRKIGTTFPVAGVLLIVSIGN